MILIPIIPSLIAFSVNSFFSNFKRTNKPRLTIDNKGNVVFLKVVRRAIQGQLMNLMYIRRLRYTKLKYVLQRVMKN